MEEPLEAYLAAFEDRRDAVETLLEETVDLTQLEEKAASVVCDPRLLEALRYVAGPPISLDDLKVVANVVSTAPKTLASDNGVGPRLVETIMLGLDRRRFPWLSEGREAQESERQGPSWLRPFSLRHSA